jgi:DNA polymerase I
VPLEVTLEALRVTFPFAQSLKENLRALSFFSLLKREELFLQDKESAASAPGPAVQVHSVTTLDDLKVVVHAGLRADRVGLVLQADKLSIGIGSLEYTVPLVQDLLSGGLQLKDCVAVLKELLASSTPKVVYDAKAMMHTLAHYNAALCSFDDVRLMAYLVDVVAASLSIQELLERYGVDSSLGVGMLMLSQKLIERLDTLNMSALYRDIERPLVSVLYAMERRGFAIDEGILCKLGADYVAQLDILSAQIKDIARTPSLNVNSPKQLAKVLFEDMRLPYPYPKSKTISTAADILHEVQDNTGIIALILRYRELSKLNSTYVEGLLRLSRKGVVHTDFRQMLVATGRLSSVEPNLQNIPVRTIEGRALRAAFVARPGCSLICADYSQIELRLLAHLSMDANMIAAFEEGQDIHTMTAAQVFGVTKDAVTIDMRRAAKAVNFGIIYGISDFGLAADIKVSVTVAGQYIKTYFAKYPSIKVYLDDCVKKAKAQGGITTLYGRVRKIPELQSAKKSVVAFGERIAMNMPMQGSASDIIKIAMNAVAAALVPFDAHLLHQVHDELIVECATDQVESVKQILCKCMTTAAALRVPLVVDMSVGRSWG